MKQLWIACIVAALMAPWAGAQEIPQEVAEPYSAYRQAMDGSDNAAASRWAIAAWRAAQAADLDNDTLGALASNAINATAAANDSFALSDLAVDVANWFSLNDDNETAAYIFAMALSEASEQGDHVGYRMVLRSALLWLAGLDRPGDEIPRIILRAPDPAMPNRLAARQSPPEAPLPITTQQDVRTYANAQLDRIHAAMNREDWEDAHARLQHAVGTLLPLDAQAEESMDALLSLQSEILFRAFGDQSAGLQHLPVGMHDAWCGFLRREPQPVSGGEDVLYPVLAMQRGIAGGVSRTRLVLSAEGGRPETSEPVQPRGPQRQFDRASQRHWSRVRFRSQCDANLPNPEYEVVGGFAVMAEEASGGGAAFAARTATAWQPAGR